MTRHAETLVEIGADDHVQFVDAILEEVVGLGDDRMLDDDALLGLQLLDQRQDLFQRRDAILVAVDEEARTKGRGRGS